MTTRLDISVTAPLAQAFERVKIVLFRPFDAAKWFVIGFCAWLAYLGEGGFHGGGNYNFGGRRGGAASLGKEIGEARDYIMNNIAWIVPLAILVLLILAAIWLVILWLNSRGRFMFLHCVALNKAEIAVPWKKFDGEANSLFLFRVVLSLIAMFFTLPVVVGLIVVIMRMIIRERATPGGILSAVGLFAALMLVSAVFWVIGRLMKDFVVPIQFLRGSSCLNAWRELLRGLLRGNPGTFVLYLLFRIALAIGIAIVILTVVVVTCCIAGCLFLIPYLGTVFLLPVYVLERSYSLHFLAQFGRDYDVFPPEEPPTLPAI